MMPRMIDPAGAISALRKRLVNPSEIVFEDHL
jgi:hypothetical protein